MVTTCYQQQTDSEGHEKLMKLRKTLGLFKKFCEETKNVHVPIKTWAAELWTINEGFGPSLRRLRDSIAVWDENLTDFSLKEKERSFRESMTGGTKPSSPHLPPPTSTEDKCVETEIRLGSTPAITLDGMRDERSKQVAVLPEGINAWKTVSTNKKKLRKKKFDETQADVNRPPAPPPPLVPSDKKRRKLRPKRDAVIIKLKEEDNTEEEKGSTYASIAAALKEKVDLSKLGVAVDKFRITKKGHLLIEVANGQTSTSDFCSAVSNAVGDLGEVCHLQDRVTIQVLGIDINIDNINMFIYY
jgi:hypothetical protein